MSAQSCQRSRVRAPSLPARKSAGSISITSTRALRSSGDFCTLHLCIMLPNIRGDANILRNIVRRRSLFAAFRNRLIKRAKGNLSRGVWSSDLVLLNGSETGASALDGFDVCRKHILAVGAFAESDTRELIFMSPACGAVVQFRERWVTRLDRAFQVPARRDGKSERQPLRARALSQLAARRAGAPWQRRATALVLPEAAARRALEPRTAMARILPMAREGAGRRNGARGQRVVMARTLPTARYDRASPQALPVARQGGKRRSRVMARVLTVARVHSRA
jgi:hypothetical protein